MQMRLVILSRKDDRIDVLGHEGRSDVDLCVSIGSTGKDAGNEKNGRHPVPEKRMTDSKKDMKEEVE